MTGQQEEVARALRSAYSQWFMGYHEGTAPAKEPCETPDHLYGESYHLNGMDGVVGQIAGWREEILRCMDLNVITRDDQFGVFLQLCDALTEAIDGLLEIGWPVERADGAIVWESTSAAVTETETAELAAVPAGTQPALFEATS